MLLPYTPYFMFVIYFIIYFSHLTDELFLKRRGVATGPVRVDLPARC